MGKDTSFWSGGKNGAEGGVAILVATKWQKDATEVKRVSERIMLVRVGKRKLCLCRFLRHRREEQWWARRSSMKRLVRS